MRSEHVFHVTCPRAEPGGMHAVRLVVDDERLIHLSADCPEDLASDAAERLGAPWCSHMVARVRASLGEHGAALHDSVLMSVLGLLHAQAGIRRKNKERWRPFEPDDRPLIVQYWHRQAQRIAPHFEVGVRTLDGLLHLFVGEGGYGPLVIARKARARRWVRDESNIVSASSSVGRQYIGPDKERCSVCDSGPYKSWSRHARSDAHRQRATAALHWLVGALNQLPSVRGLSALEYDPRRLRGRGPSGLESAAEAMQRQGVHPYG